MHNLKSQTKKPLSILLALLMLVSVSCSSQKQPDTKETQKETMPTETKEPEETKVLYKADVPERDFGGAQFRVGGIEPSLYPSLIIDFDFEEDSADVVNSSIYKRNRAVEEAYNVDIISEYLGDYNAPTDILKQCSMSGDNTYQMMMLICRSAFSSALNGYTLPYKDIPYINPEQPWYLHHINDMMKIGEESILLYTDLSFSAYMYTSAIFFNKSLAAQYDMEDLYTIVRDGKWTIDKFYQLASDVIRDVNGDGKYEEGDVFGVVSESDGIIPALWVGTNTTTITKLEDGTPSFTAPTDEKLISVLDGMTDMLKKDGFYFNSFKVYGVAEQSRNLGTQYFAQNGSLFRIGQLGQINMMRNMEADFGILPLPKYDEAQDTYYGRMEDGWVYVIPNAPQDTELVGTIFEALSAESRNYVIPAFFDVALTNKYMRDTDSEEMLNMIFNNVLVDLGDTIWYDTIRAPIQSYVETLKGGYASKFASMEKNVQKRCIDKTIETLANRDS